MKTIYNFLYRNEDVEVKELLIALKNKLAPEFILIIDESDKMLGRLIFFDDGEIEFRKELK